jgi:putative endonuclease
MTTPPRASRSLRGGRAHAGGIDAEALACAALVRDGWTVLGRRVRTSAGEVDAIAERDGLVAFLEVKRRATLTDAAWALTARQRKRLLGAAEILLAEHPEWGRAGVRFDVLLVDAAGVVRRVADAFRQEV